MDPDRSRPSWSGDAFRPIFSDLDVRDLINNDPDREEDDLHSGDSDVDENHGHTLNDLMRESIEEPIENLVLDLEASPSSSDRPNDQVYEAKIMCTGLDLALAPHVDLEMVKLKL
ncbi:hypothetical protein PoB_001362600 [Plakobranchus ocellatus]|uniref:Uncharacterized protein n=1 Tax=Plakobranchus ocellatus TaxID=259542 RepID=A0AAV3YUL3_9GAST|nr:hypothetical protein PoB_001362600 [Plakobranchus ocellatus]